MTAPPLYQNAQPQTPQAPRQFAGRRRFTTSGAGFGETPQQPDQGALQMPQQQQRPRTQRPPTPQGPSQSPTAQPGQPQQPRPTFAQMQAQGQARPAPQQVQPQQPIQGQLQQSVSQALANPSAYGAPQVQQTFDMLNQRLGQDYDYQRKRLNEEMASRGISESTIAGQRYSDLATEQSRAQSDLATQLATQAAQTYGSDRSAALNAALGLNSQGLQQDQLALQRELGLGGLGIQAGQLTGNYNGQSTLGAQQLSQSGQQFNLQQALAEKLGLGGLGIQQGQLDLSKQLGMGNLDLQNRSLAQSGSQFNLQQALAEKLGMGGLDLQNRSLAQSGQQFNQQQALAEKLGLGNLNLSQQDLALRQKSNDQQFGLQSQAQTDQRSQFLQQLQQQLGIATMGDKTQNRGIDAQAALAQNDLYMKLAQILPGLFPGGSSSYSGGGGSSSSGGATGGTGGSSNYWDVPPGEKPTVDQFTQAYQAMNPGKPVPSPTSREAQEWIQQHPPSTWKPTNTTTVNFGDKQYTQQEWDAYTKAHPNWWQTGGASQDLSWLNSKPQTFYDPETAGQYAGTPNNTGGNPFDQAYFDTHTNEQYQQDVDKFNFNTAKNDSSASLDALLRSGGVFSDTVPKGTTYGDPNFGQTSTQQWINDQLRKAGYNPDGSRIR